MKDTIETEPQGQPAGRKATLYRMVMDKHLCPYGLKSKALLERKGFDVEDHPLTTREQTEAFKREHGVETTPQAFIGRERIGGYSELRAHFGNPLPEEGATSYKPVIAIFGTAFAMALAFSWAALGAIAIIPVIEWFIAIAMVMLGIQKLQDVESFSTMFLNYDLLAQREPRYGYVYPYAETGAGLLMIAGTLLWIAIPVALFIGTIGAVSVFKAVYIDKRELKCACVGGSSRVPLGFVSLTENVMMVAMALWMLFT
ncbi:MauE/DoxX family redox-associated membrane protein [Profundibacterium mesophilum]|uniref:Methylamine utilization protein MauE n=1 Tax=Profundibacterium mesophilum KAUST100406-0324 TaxID=1037889 RepID=A0A921NXA7_9RHOB|nr:glutaredoxin [Profundibacterium mesophilum]KAF0676449.1 thioredoxin reductase [Profundibacterium mesophilum KAUST100406-0324]